jgi:N utilization substance protein B
VLYALDLSAAGEGPVDAREAFERVATHFDLRAGARDFAEELALGVAARRDELDARIAVHARNWRVDRMAAVDRNVLRLAAYELLHTETPASVVIDEAVDLARDFGGERSPAFVNGVLDALARERRGAPVALEAPEG